MILKELQDALLIKLRAARARLDEDPNAADLDKLRIDSLLRAVEKNESDELLLELLQTFHDAPPEASEPEDFRIEADPYRRDVRVADRFDGEAGRFLDFFFHLRNLNELQELYGRLPLYDPEEVIHNFYEYAEIQVDDQSVIASIQFPGQDAQVRFFQPDAFIHVLEQYLDAWEAL